MLFNSLPFLIFFPSVVLIFFLLPHRFRWILLLVASYYFYMSWNPAYGFLLFATTVVDYTVGLLMGGTASRARRRAFLFLSLAINLGVLFTFKYFNFFFDTLAPLAEYFIMDFESPALRLLLPVGLSFYVLQSLSYTIDVYRGTRTAERHFGMFALYVSFFPQLVAGPIETSTHLLPQFHKNIGPDPERFVTGLRLMLWGFFKKIVIADNAALIVNAVYGDSGSNGIALFAATVFFAIQIYADFSGYTDIARGSARILGYDLTRNFERPYFSRSIGEFWRRWHMSLMYWFRHYIYFPLGGNRVRDALWVRNIVLIFLISGVWHGANWTFVAWGLINALYIIIGKYTEGVRNDLSSAIGITRMPQFRTLLQVATTFGLTLVAWVFFRSQTLSEAVSVLHTILADTRSLIYAPSGAFEMILQALYSFHMNRVDLVVLAGAIVFLFSVEYRVEQKGSVESFLRLPRPLRWCAYYAVILCILCAGNFGESAFIYFQF